MQEGSTNVSGITINRPNLDESFLKQATAAKKSINCLMKNLSMEFNSSKYATTL